MDQGLRALLILMVPLLLLMSVMIGIFLYRTRTRKLTEYKLDESVESIQIDLTPILMKDSQQKLKRMKYAPILVLVGSYLFVASVLVLGEGPEGIQELTRRGSPLFFANGVLVVCMSIGAILGHLRIKPLLKNIEMAYQLSQNKKLEFKIKDNVMTIPTLQLANPAFWRAIEKGEHQIEISLDDIETLEVYPAAGKAHAQYKILAKGEVAQYGLGRLGKSDGPMFGICIKREGLRARERHILSLLQKHLKEKVLIKDEISST